MSFVIGKRMLVSHEPNPKARRKGGFLVYECAARALQAALYRPRGRLASATKAVLRVRAARPCAPPSSQWPTVGGVWAFEVIIPESIALEHQTWMDDRSLAAMWLPASPPGLCRQCALGSRVCVQVRNSLEMGQPPMYFHGARGAGGARAAYDGRGRGMGKTWERMLAAEQWAEEGVADGEERLDVRSFV